MLSALKGVVRTLCRSVGLEIRRLPSMDSLDRRYSNFNEQSVIKRFLDQHIVESRYCVDIGAGDGVSMSNTFPLFRDGWGGLAVDCNADKFSSLASFYVHFPNVTVARCKMTPHNVIPLLGALDVPEKFGFLTLDIDGYDYFVLEQILARYRPGLICAEINEKIPPPVKFTVQWDPAYVWAEDHFYGQSISQLYTLCLRHNYALVELHYNNAFLIPWEYSPESSLTPEEAYRSGYLDKPDRKKRFPWNGNVEEWLHMKPEEALMSIQRYFENYEGRYDASIAANTKSR